MRFMPRLTIAIALFISCFFNATASFADNATDNVSVPVLAYHRFGATVPDSMTVTTSSFAAQLKWLKDNGYTIIPLKTLMNYLSGQGAAPPAKSVVITADDGHKSVYTDMFPLIKKYNIPVTLFIYPSAISNASYALTWQQLQEMQKTGLFDVQSHTYWHPNFKREKKKQSPEEYQKFVDNQMLKSKATLEKKIGGTVDILAWPFGIYDEELEKDAQKAGYIEAYSIDNKSARKGDNAMAVPRYLMINAYGVKGLESIVMGKAEGKGAKEG